MTITWAKRRLRGISPIGLVQEREEGMGTASTLVDAVVAKAPVAFITRVAAPVALIRPSLAPGAERSTLESLCRILRGKCPPAVSTTRSYPGRKIAFGIQHMWLLGIPSDLTGCLIFLPFGECGVAEAKPVLAATTAAVARQTNIPVAVKAYRTRVM